MTDAPDPGIAESLALAERLRRWFRDAAAHSLAWRRAAMEDFAFYAGDQWSPEDRALLQEQQRPVITFNRIGPVIDAVCGTEVNNRQEVRYIPRETGDAAVNELLTRAADYVRDGCAAADAESDAFHDLVVCGMGWIETRLEYGDDPAGQIRIDRIDPIEMYWDPSARQRNLADARYLFRVRQMDREAAQALFPEADPRALHAGWVAAEEIGLSTPQGDREGDSVTLVEAQWWDRLRDAKGGPSRRVYRRAFLGADVLALDPLPDPHSFSFFALTGKRDRNAGTFYGLVRPMKDPQRWANKWLSQTLFIVNTTAKGKLLAETDAFAEPRRAEEDWTRPDAITFLNPGGLGKILQLNPPGFPQQLNVLLDLAINGIRDAAGVNPEMLGAADRVQAGVLEYQRRQSGVTLLAGLFDSLRAYRQRQGRSLAELIRRYLADGRLIRLVGEGGLSRYVPLMRLSETQEFDVVVDAAPTAPNEKDRVWSVLMALWPLLREAKLPAQIWSELIRYSPLPDSLARQIGGAVAGQAQAGDPTLEAANGRIKLAQAEAELRKTRSEAAENEADALLRLLQAQRGLAPEQAENKK